MDVSNSTGETTDYKVTVKGGGTAIVPHTPKSGKLRPGEQLRVEAGFGQSWKAEFSIDGQVIASIEVHNAAARLELIRDNGAYRVNVT